MVFYSKTEISESFRGDIFADTTESTRNKALEVSCPECQRTITASRFAPHLEKCMGMGRISRRIASKRYAIVYIKNFK